MAEPAATTTLFFVRHGQTSWNAEGRLQGHLDSTLSRTGRSQARALGRRLVHERAHALYSSDLGRAKETAELIARATGHAVEVDARLRERGLGVLEGLTREEARGRHPGVWEQYLDGPADYVVPEGESSEGRQQRVLAACADIVRRHMGERVVVVTHGGVLDGVLRHCLLLPLDGPRTFVVRNAGLSAFEVDAAGHWRLATWGEVGHLHHMGSDEDDVQPK
jgi:2,3-bisphosphoglycerate-dependent phosphoglycerate mutase